MTHAPQEATRLSVHNLDERPILVVLLLLVLFPLVGCMTTYRLRVRTYPPQVASVYLDGELKGETSPRGELRFSSKHSIFANPELEVRKGDQRGLLILRFAQPTIGVERVAMALTQEVGLDRHTSVVFSLVEIPVPEPRKCYTGGRNTLSVRNASSVAVWVSLREEFDGADLLLSEGENVNLALPDGRYKVYLLYEGEEDVLFVLRQETELDGEGGVVVIPSIENRSGLVRRVGDPAHLGVW